MENNCQDFQKLTGFYRGKVVKHLPNGSLKVYIPDVYSTSNPEQLPDCEQAAPLFGGTNKGNGCFSYPNLGSIVWCFFQNGDQNFPVCFAVTLGGENAQEQYSEARCEASEGSVTSGDDARVHKINIDQSTIKIWESGHIEVITVDERINPPTKYSTIDIAGSGNITIKCSQQVCIDAPDIITNSNSMTVNTQTLKVNVGNSTELKTQTLKVKAEDVTQIQTENMRIKSNQLLDVKATSGTTMYDTAMNMYSKIINIDAAMVKGNVKITGKDHPAIFI